MMIYKYYVGQETEEMLQTQGKFGDETEMLSNSWSKEEENMKTLWMVLIT